MTLIDKTEAVTLLHKIADDFADPHVRGAAIAVAHIFTERADALPPAKQEHVADSNARGVGVKPDRATFDAMCAMRDSINEHVPMPSLESDLLQGPENSVFCATVAEAVINEVARLRSMTNGARVKRLEWHNFDAWTHWAEGACGTYHVEERNGYWQVELRVGGLVHGVTDTGDTTPEDLDAAKAAAQADYEARILAALAPTDAPHVNETPKSEHDAGNVLTDAQDDPECTCCGGTGITYQTERRCACQGPDLTDPTTVHVNMLRGTIAKPTVEQIIHLYGREAFQPMIDVAIGKALEKACLAASEDADWPEDEHGRTEQVELFARVINAIHAITPAENAAAPNLKRIGTGIYETQPAPDTAAKDK